MLAQTYNLLSAHQFRNKWCDSTHVCSASRWGTAPSSQLRTAPVCSQLLEPMEDGLNFRVAIGHLYIAEAAPCAHIATYSLACPVMINL